MKRLFSLRAFFKKPSRKFSPSRRRNRFVRLLKILLPAIAALLGGLVIIWPRLEEAENRFRLSIVRPTSTNIDRMKMLRARYYGTDEHNQPFLITADQAEEISAENHRVSLSAPKADIMVKSGKWIAAMGKEGLYDPDASTLSLSGGVTLYHDDGYVLQTPSVKMNVSAGSARGTEEVTAEGPFGRIRATGLKITEKGARITFPGPADVLLHPEVKPPRES